MQAFRLTSRVVQVETCRMRNPFDRNPRKGGLMQLSDAQKLALSPKVVRRQIMGGKLYPIVRSHQPVYNWCAHLISHGVTPNSISHFDWDSQVDCQADRILECQVDRILHMLLDLDIGELLDFHDDVRGLQVTLCLLCVILACQPVYFEQCWCCSLPTLSATRLMNASICWLNFMGTAWSCHLPLSQTWRRH